MLWSLRFREINNKKAQHLRIAGLQIYYKFQTSRKIDNENIDMPESLDPITYYASPGMMTDPGKYSSLLINLPVVISDLCGIVQTNLIHVFWAERYGIILNDEQKQTLNLRKLSEKLFLIDSHDPRPLIEKREINMRQVGNCRDFSLLLTALLRHQGIPARSRCGFGTYFLPDHYEDHWISEYWNNTENRWVMVDSQLDPFQIKTLDIQFNPLDVPSDQFIIAGKAWQMCRSGIVNPEQFGIFDMHGWWFIWGNVIRDFFALNKIEILPWDGGWGFLTHNLDDPLLNGEELHVYDHIAALTVNPENNFYKIRSFYENDSRFHLPEDV
jgi:hypothetical protein